MLERCSWAAAPGLEPVFAVLNLAPKSLFFPVAARIRGVVVIGVRPSLSPGVNSARVRAQNAVCSARPRKIGPERYGARQG